MRILKQSVLAEKLKRRDPLAFLKLQFAEKHENFEGRQKNSKSCTVPKKITLRPYSLARFCILR